jgi:hypothetical protein
MNRIEILREHIDEILLNMTDAVERFMRHEQSKPRNNYQSSYLLKIFPFIRTYGCISI